MLPAVAPQFATSRHRYRESMAVSLDPKKSKTIHEMIQLIFLPHNKGRTDLAGRSPTEILKKKNAVLFTDHNRGNREQARRPSFLSFEMETLQIQ